MKIELSKKERDLIGSALLTMSNLHNESSTEFSEIKSLWIKIHFSAEPENHSIDLTNFEWPFIL